MYFFLTKYEYTVSNGRCAIGFEAGLCAAVPAEQLHTFLTDKIMLLLRKFMPFSV